MTLYVKIVQTIKEKKFGAIDTIGSSRYVKAELVENKAVYATTPVAGGCTGAVMSWVGAVMIWAGAFLIPELFYLQAPQKRKKSNE